MPCQDYGPSYAEVEASEAKSKLKDMKLRLDKYARMLCYVCDSVQAIDPELANKLFDQNAELAVWYAKHQIDDAAAEKKRQEDHNRKVKAQQERERQIQLRKNAKAKLNEDELAALGIKE